MNIEVTIPMPETDIKVGDWVKSYDFPDNLVYDSDRAEKNYVVGMVIDIVDRLPHPDGGFYKTNCNHYKIIAEYRVVDGEVKHTTRDCGWRECYPPVNGVDQMFSEFPTHGVKKYFKR